MSEPDWRDLLDPDDDTLEYDDMEQPEENTYGDFQDAANQHQTSPVIEPAEAAERVADGAVIIDSSKAALALFVTSEGQVNIRSVYGNAQVAVILRQIADKAEQRHREGKNRG